MSAFNKDTTDSCTRKKLCKATFKSLFNLKFMKYIFNCLAVLMKGVDSISSVPKHFIKISNYKYKEY